MSYRSKFYYFLLVLFCLPFFAQAQIGISPYSSQGLGNLVTPGFTHNMGMGGVGIATGNGLRINNLNPAMLYKNSLTTFDVAFTVENNRLSNSRSSIQKKGGGLAYGAFVFPVMNNRWSISIGLNPYSHVGYAVQDSSTVVGSETRTLVSLNGEGGTSQVYAASGFRIIDNLSVGAKISYLFGGVDRSVNTLPLTSNNISYSTSYQEGSYYSGLVPEFGLYYGLKIGKLSTLSFGATLQPQTNLNVEQNVVFYVPSINTASSGLGVDTLSIDTGTIVLPQKIGFGISMQKQLKYMVGIDLTMQQWENYDAIYDNNLDLPVGLGSSLQNSMKLSVGGEFIPDATSVNSYLKRVAYRLGFNYQNTPYYFSSAENPQDGEQIQDISLSLGMSLPLSNLSSLNLAFEAGRRGRNDNGLILQNYYRITLGVSFNDRWFVRRKYD